MRQTSALEKESSDDVVIVDVFECLIAVPDITRWAQYHSWVMLA